MLKLGYNILAALFIQAASFNLAMAQEHRWDDIDTTGYYNKEVIRKEGLTLIFINKDPQLADSTRQHMITTFFTVYPRETKRFDHIAPKKVTFFVGTEYKGVAATEGALIKFDELYLRNNPRDYDIVTHELIHVIQDYPAGSDVPGWITEGIADYGRYIYGVNNYGAHWALPDYKEPQLYTDGYRVTARFFAWLSRTFRPDLMEKLNTAVKHKPYSPDLWIHLTGKSLDELWYLYNTDPKI